MSETSRQRLRALLAGPDTLCIPGAYDALSAKLVQEAGFQAVYIGSYATAASAHGYADVGLLALDDLARHAKTVVDAVGVPVIADAEGGFFDPPNMWRCVRAFEEAGVAAIHIEDHAGGKHTGLPQQLLPVETMLQRLRAALDARRDADFQIIARTDAIWAQNNIEEAIKRVRLFADTGVDMVMPTMATPDTARTIAREVPCKVLALTTTQAPRFADWHGCADLVIDYGFCLFAAAQGVKNALALLQRNAGSAEIDQVLESPAEFEARFGYADFVARSRKYSP
jgi:methylisocitrate lyase